MKKSFRLLLLLAILMMGQRAFADTPLIFCGVPVTDAMKANIRLDDYAKPYDATQGDYWIWLEDGIGSDGNVVWTLHLRNVLVNYTEGIAFNFMLGYNDNLVIDIKDGAGTSKVVAKGNAISVLADGAKPKVFVNTPDKSPVEALILESTEDDALLLENSTDELELYLHAHLQVRSTADASLKKAAIACLSETQLYLYGRDNGYGGGSFLKAKSNYASILGIDRIFNNDMSATFNFSPKEYEGVGYAVYNTDDPEQQITSGWCYVNNKEYPVWVAGTRASEADTWGESSIESPYITSGAVNFDIGTTGDYIVYLDAATIDIPADVTDVPGIWCSGGMLKIVVREHPGTINVPSCDGIHIDGESSYTEITQVTTESSYLKSLFINARRGINIVNKTGAPYQCNVTERLSIFLNGETGIKMYGTEATDFYYLTGPEKGSKLSITSTGNGIELENGTGTPVTQAYFGGKGELNIDAGCDGISLKDATIHLVDEFTGSINAQVGAGINGNQSMSYVRKESAESKLRFRGGAGAINDVYGLVFGAGCGEIIQEENKDDATMEKLHYPFQTYVQDGQPYTGWAVLRYVEKLFQIGDYVLDDHNSSYFDSLIPGVFWNSYKKVLTLTNAKITATGENIGLRSLLSEEVSIILKGDNVIEAEGIGLLNDMNVMQLYSEDGKGKLSIVSTTDKGIKNNRALFISNCKLDITAEQEAFYNTSGLQMENCEATFTGKHGGYIGDETSVLFFPQYTSLTCTGSEVDGVVYPSCRGYNANFFSSIELLTPGYVLTHSSLSPEFWVEKSATGMVTGETIQFGVKPENVYYGISINGISVTGITYTSIEPAELKSGKISYDPVERELILDNVEMDAASIRIYMYKAPLCKKVKLVGENTINGNYYSFFFQNEEYCPVTIYSEDGKGKLTVNGSSGDTYGFDAFADVTIKDCEVAVNNMDYYGFYGNDFKLTLDHANASFCGNTGSVVNLGGLVFDPGATFPETKLVAPKNAVFNSSTGNIEVDGSVVEGEPVVFRWVKRYYVFVGSEEMNSENCADFHPAGLAGGTVSYDPEQSVLTLDNAQITEILRIGGDAKTIKLVGKNKVNSPYSGLDIMTSTTITSEDKDNRGELTVIASGDGIQGSADATIEDCTVKITATGFGVYFNNGATLTVNDAFLRVEGTPSMLVPAGLVLGEGMDITEPYGAIYNKLTGCVEVNGEPTSDEIIITKLATANIATTVPVKISLAGAAGFSYNKALDFTGLPVSAWISTGMRNGDIQLSRVLKVPAGTGIYLKGQAGEIVTCDVPITEDDSYYANMFVGVPAGKTIEEMEATPSGLLDYYQTYYFALSKTTATPTFYPTTSDGKTLAQNKMYLRMPATVDPNAMDGELQEETVEVTVGTAGAAGFSCDKALDFTGSEISAWIATGFSGGNIQLSRVFAVPANTGVYLKGKAGEKITDQIHVTTETPYYRNFFRATGTTEIMIPQKMIDDETALLMQTLYFAKSASTGAPTFYPTDIMGKELGANKMFLCLPAALMPEPAPARAFGVEFLEDDVLETTGICEASPFENEKMRNGEDDGEHQSSENRGGVYDLQGRKLQTSIFKLQSSKFKKGVYIQNGRKIIKK